MASDTYCTQCGHVGYSCRITPGNTFTTFILLLLFFVPGLLYWIWRNAASYEGCCACGARAIIPMSSPILEGKREALAAASKTADVEANVEANNHANDVIKGLVFVAALLLIWAVFR